MENVTYLDAGPEVVRLVDDLVEWDDQFKALRGIGRACVWSRQQARRLAGEDLMCWPDITDNLALHLTEGAIPHYALVFGWKAVNELRKEGQYLHPEILERHIHRALLMLEVSESGALGTRSPTVQTFPETVARYGFHTPAEQMLRQQVEMRLDSPVRVSEVPNATTG